MSWESTPDGRFIGYRVARLLPDGRIVSQANSRLSFDPPTAGVVHTMPGRGMFLANTEAYVLDYYAGSDPGENILLVYSFDPDEAIGCLTDAECEISVPKAALISWRVF